MKVDARGQMTEAELDEMEQRAMSATTGISAVASAAMVNRTHRMVRERAKSLAARRSKARSLWIPLAVSGGLLVVIVCAIWTVLDEYELAPTGLPDANQQLLVLMMWCLPISVALMAVVWLKRGTNGSRADDGSVR